MADRTWTGRVVIKSERKGTAFKSAGKGVDGFASSLKKLGAIAGVAGVGQVFLKTAETIKVFEKSISDLSAITGATGADLDKLTAASKRIGQTTTLSASQAAEAFQLMASAKPDLLENLDALEATTEAAVTLAEAAGLELPAAATALGESLNQFGKGAEDADRFINVLAASSQKGAALINEVNLSLKGAGVAASQAGLTFEQTNAQIQTLAFAGLKGAEAGTKLRTVLVKLQTQANDEFNPAVVGIDQALLNLADANLGVTERTKLFGEEALITADILIAGGEASAKLAGEITGTTTAQEQAQKRTDNLDGSMKRLSSAMEAVQLSFSNTSGPMRVVVDTAADIANTIAKLNSDSDPGSISVAGALFEGLAFSLKTLFTAGIVVKNALDQIVAVLGFVGKSLASLIQGDFDLLDDHLRELQENIQAQEDDVGAAAAGIWNPELAAEVDANMRAHFQEPAVTVARETGEAVVREVETAGMAKAAAEALAAEEAAAKEAEREEARIERLRTRNLTERELALENFTQRLAENQELFELEIITEEQNQERKVMLAQKTADRLLAIDKKRASDSKMWEELTTRQKVETVIKGAVQMTQGVAQHSKTMFKINKAAGIANAVVNTAQGITRALAEYSPPVSFVMAALQAAAGLVQINAIKSTSFGGGGTGTTPSAAGSAPVINSQPVGGVGASGFGSALPPDVGGPASGLRPGQDVTIKLEGLDEGGLLTADQVRSLMGSISEQLGDGVEIDTGG